LASRRRTVEDWPGLILGSLATTGRFVMSLGHWRSLPTYFHATLSNSFDHLLDLGQIEKKKKKKKKI
jgi:hypothetical protein